MNRNHLRRNGSTIIAGLVLICSSCAKEARAPVYPVQGKVYFQGRPAAGAIVFFHPLTQSGSAKQLLLPQGTIESDGTFRLTTYDDGDGAPAGDYKVSVIWRRTPTEKDEEPLELLPPRYLNPATSGLTAQVQSGPTELQRFQLNSTPMNIASGRDDQRGGR